ncbi:MAG: MBOAT family protein [Bacteroidales bacterium]|nr:MBOAT family protein [Bacteroidales bacterium]
MLFNTIEFVFFLPAVIIIYFLVPSKYRWILLLVASYYFYMCWKIEYIILIISSTLIDYFSAIQIENAKKKQVKRAFLILSLVTNLGLLFSFKYFNFFSESVNILFNKINIAYQTPELNVLLPVGISFYTFQTLSYSIDVYTGKQKAEHHLGYFALYVSFFPQLVAGPIERFSRLTPQLKAKHTFSYDNLKNGLRLILYGLFIKMVIADNISVYVDQIYNNPAEYGSFDILKGIFFYSFQIYSDFYGYSIIAIGSALIMGIKIMDNFKTPYLAKNIAEFWQRWHISLSTWFRDYLYFPLGGNKVKKYRWFINVLIVFLVSGLWHGANWTFIFWGGLFGIIYLTESIVNKALKVKSSHTSFSIKHILLALKTFILVTFIWVFFRSQSISEAFNIFELIGNNFGKGVKSLSVDNITLMFFVLFLISDVLLYNKRFDKWVDKVPFVSRWSIYFILIFSIIVFSGVDDAPFIYFQF